MAVEARQQAQHGLIEPLGKAPGGAVSAIAPRQDRERGGGHGVERDRRIIPHTRLQQGTARVPRDLRDQCVDDPVVLQVNRRQANYPGA